MRHSCCQPAHGEHFFGLNHHLVKSSEDLKIKIKNAIRNKSFTVLEIKTDGTDSIKFRKNYWTSAVKKIQPLADEPVAQDKEFAAK